MKTIYKNNSNNSARFLLGEKGTKPLCIFGINPSTATDINSDQTATKIRNFASINGYDGYYIFNLYPMRATNPKLLHRHPNKKIINKNINIIQQTISPLNHVDIWAAWGNTIKMKPYLLNSLELIIKKLININNIKWYRCGTLTNEGHPRHPSRLAYNNKLYKFNIRHYIEKHKAT